MSVECHDDGNTVNLFCRQRETYAMPCTAFTYVDTQRLDTLSHLSPVSVSEMLNILSDMKMFSCSFDTMPTEILIGVIETVGSRLHSDLNSSLLLGCIQDSNLPLFTATPQK